MYKNFDITESEKKQIMEMHQSHGYKKPVVEQEYDSSEPEQQQVSANSSSGGNDDEMIEKMMRYFQFVKVGTKALDNDRVMKIYRYEEGKYSIGVFIAPKNDMNIARILYIGPSFGDPKSETTEDLTERWFQKSWIRVQIGDNRFPKAVDAAIKHLKNIMKYHNVKPLK